MCGDGSVGCHQVVTELLHIALCAAIKLLLVYLFVFALKLSCWLKFVVPIRTIIIVGVVIVVIVVGCSSGLGREIPVCIPK